LSLRGRGWRGCRIRRIFREDFSLLGDQFSTEDAWAFDLGIGFRF
jgi:hypothetical protein